jgi:hypothetical protein
MCVSDTPMTFLHLTDVYTQCQSCDFLQRYHPIPRRDSISRPKATISSLAGGDDTTM